MPGIEVEKRTHYYNAFVNAMDRWLDNPEQDFKSVFKKMILYGVKYINSLEEPQFYTRKDIENRFKFADNVMSMMANLTPREFMNLFPVAKEYDGHRWETKDYFYTTEYIKKLAPDEPIGNKIEDFLWNYTNREIETFIVKLFCFASDLQRFDTGKGIMDEFCEQNGIRTYRLFKDSSGKEYLIDNQTGRTMRARKAIPRYLRVIKGVRQ